MFSKGPLKSESVGNYFKFDYDGLFTRMCETAKAWFDYTIEKITAHNHEIGELKNELLKSHKDKEDEFKHREEEMARREKQLAE